MSKGKIKIIKSIQEGQSIAQLLEQNEEYKLLEGKNIIDVLDKSGKIIRKKVVTFTGDESKVVKSMQDETDIKTILKKYGRTGMLPIIKDEGLYGDFSTMPDYQEAQNIIIKADKQFAALDSDVRKRFDNDPAIFLQFCSDPKNSEEMVKLGLMKAPQQPSSPVKVQVINTGESNESKTS